ncbi:uncharacterized protein DFL_009681 [Arthrobotrys flagrans]|uniref:SUN domain-containing protein n=1 Tax=Arthrobotrys flagrans TaxID=97331 RepID=A0A436ZSC6_ARTFL|nr:hypothetical protein DFL_009681 [Arthrobotrys flagrans]
MKGKCSRAWLLQLHLLGLVTATAAALITGSSSEPKQPTVTVGGSLGITTCPFRTANYINHGLPQQCLRTSRVVSAAAGAARALNATGRLEVSDDGPRSSASPSVEEVGLATTTSIDLGQKFERPITSPSEDIPPPTEDAETPIDTANFLSFEEWKKQNLAKAGQSAENFGERPPKEARRRPGSMSSALDALGVDDEIELNFDGGETEEQDEVNIKNEAKPSGTVKPTKHIKSRDAGKTCKERFNYASFDCAATVHKTNPESKGASSILVENKDSYMLNKCGAKNKFIIVELCDDILVDTVVLANYEFFSSMFRTFKVSVSDRYPVKSAGWKELGLFEAKNSREIQAFLVENPLIWARYIRIEFLTHFGKEFYCPISLLRVHGTTMMEEFRHQEEQARGYTDESEEMEPEAIAKPIEEAIEEEQAVHKAEVSSQTAAEESSVPTGEYAPPIQSTVPLAPDSVGPALANPTERRDHTTSEASDIPAVGSERQEKDIKSSSSIGQSPPSTPTPPAQKEHRGHSSPETDPTITGVPVSEKAPPKVAPRSSRPSSNDSHQSSHSKETHMPRNSSSTVPDPSRQPSAVSSTAPSPTTQESFFKTIHKRLQLLEANATLSLQYIEEQSKLMRDTFSKMEKRQFNKSASYLDQLNMTVFKELREFRAQYDQLWQSTVIALDTQRELSEREILAISARLTMLADEVVFQKRMTIAQSFLMLVIVCLIVFSKTQHLEAGIVRTVFSGRSQDHLGLESPPTSPSPPRNRPKSGRAASHKRRLREYAHQRRDSSDLDIPSPIAATLKRNPIPAQFYRNAGSISVDNISDVIQLDDDDGSTVSPPLLPQLTQSSPATPSGLKERRWGSSASDGEYMAPDPRVRWRPTSPLSKVSGAEEGGDTDDEGEERVPDTDRATPVGDRGVSESQHNDSNGAVDPYYL